MREIDVTTFETVSSSFDGGGYYQARVNADRTLLFRAITNRDGVFSEGWIETIVPIESPLSKAGWSEWMISERYGSTPDYAETDVIRLDGVVYSTAFAEDVYLVGVNEGEVLPDSAVLVEDEVVEILAATAPTFDTTEAEGARGVAIPWERHPTLSDDVTVVRLPDGRVEITVLVGVNSEDPDAAPEDGFAALTIPAAAWEHLRTLSAEAPAVVSA